jgi:hypothetical protein
MMMTTPTTFLFEDWMIETVLMGLVVLKGFKPPIKIFSLCTNHFDGFEGFEGVSHLSTKNIVRSPWPRPAGMFPIPAIWPPLNPANPSDPLCRSGWALKGGFNYNRYSTADPSKDQPMVGPIRLEGYWPGSLPDRPALAARGWPIATGHDHHSHHHQSQRWPKAGARMHERRRQL